MEKFNSFSVKDLKLQRESMPTHKILQKYIIKQLPKNNFSSNIQKLFFAEDIESQEILFCQIIQKKNVKIKNSIQNKIKIQNQIQRIQFALFTIKEQVKEWQTLDHRNVIKNYKLIEDKFNILILSDFPQGSTLDQLIRYSQKITYKKALQIIKQLLDGVIYLHSRNIVHLNISLRNIYCSNNKLNLFRLGIPIINYAQYEKKYDIQFHAPEFITKQSNNYKKADVFSLGVILYYLIYSTMPFQEYRTQVSYSRNYSNNYFIKKKPLKFPKDSFIPPSINYLLEDMLIFSEKQRIDVQQLRQEIIKIIYSISQ